MTGSDSSDGSHAVKDTPSEDAARAGGGRAARPATRLCGFLLLLALVFGAAHAAGTRLGPVAPGRAGTGGPPATTPGGPMGPMDMGTPGGGAAP